MHAPNPLQLAALVTAVSGLGGCAREALPPEVPGMVEARPEVQSTQGPASGSSPLPVRHGARRGKLGLSIPDGEPCLAFLAHEGVRFELLGPRPGMVTPVAV
ncbi:MAG TPA: hypothetical protein VF395_21395, partial [Polyangiaceae bacterium]